MSLRKAFLILSVLLLLALAVVFLLLRGWGGSEESRVTATISAEKGGSITSADGKLTLEILPNALAEDTKISVQPVRVDQLPAPLRDLAGSSSYRLEPNGLEFSSPVTVQLKLGHDERQPPAGVIAHLLVTQGDTGEPEFLDEVETRIALADGSTVVSGQMRHFSWLTATDHFLEVKLWQVEPSEQPLDRLFSTTAEMVLSEGAPSDIRFDELSSKMSTVGPVGLVTIDNQTLFRPPLPADQMQDYLMSEAGIEEAYLGIRSNRQGTFFGEMYDEFPWPTIVGTVNSLSTEVYLRCFEPGTGSYILMVNATAHDPNVGRPLTVLVTLVAFVDCVASEPPPTPTSGIMLPPTPTPTATPTPTPSPTPTPPRTACLMNTRLTLDGIDIVPGQYHQGRIRVNVTDQDGRPVADARVSIRTEKSDGTRTTAVGVTNAAGYVIFGMQTTRLGRNTLFITNVEKAGCLWNVTSGQSLTWEAK